MSPAPNATPWRVVNIVLAALLALALVVVVFVAVLGPKVFPGTSKAENQKQQQYVAVTGAARTALDAFLSVDYKRMDPLQDRLLKLSTGRFKRQYNAARVNIKAAAQSARVVAAPTVREVGINQIKDGKATAVVAADLVRKNSATKKKKATKACPHAGATCLYFRFTVELTETSGGWKLSDVEPVS